jgi:hypothetical protein
MMTLRIPELRVAANELLKRPKDELTAEKVVHLMKAVSSLAAELAAWVRTLPELWSYKAVAHLDRCLGTDLESSDVYPGNVDRYCDIWISSMWNSYRCCRIISHAIRIQCIAWLASSLDYKSTTECIQSYQVVQQMVDEICATVPFHLGSQTIQGQGDFTIPSPRGSPCGEDHAKSPKALGGYFLVWPLFVLQASTVYRTTNAGGSSRGSDTLATAWASIKRWSYLPLAAPDLRPPLTFANALQFDNRFPTTNIIKFGN